MRAHKYHIAIIFLILGLGTATATLSRTDFENVVFSDNRGSTNEASHGHVIYNINKGWNIVPLKFMMEASGRYNANEKEGQTCNRDIFQNVWYYSPVIKDYYHIPVIDDWGAPKTRNNNILLNEFKAKYYHIYAGSAWVYSLKNCILEGDDGTQLVSGSYGDEQQEKGYTHKELVLKAGWNFVPVDMRMAAYEKSLKELFDNCGATKFLVYDKNGNRWQDISASVNNKIPISDIFKTIVVKTTQDCNFADYEASSSTAPPSLPSGDESECNDSDNGKEYYIQGFVKSKLAGQETTYDKCYNEIYDDSTSNRLEERYCENGKLNTQLFSCPNGCSNGACIR